MEETEKEQRKHTPSNQTGDDDGDDPETQQDTINEQTRVTVLHGYDVYEEEAQKLRWLLHLYFFHPFKWTGDSISVHLGKCAIFVLQLSKVILITVMLFSSGRDREYFNHLVNRGHLTLRNIFMKHWDASWETLPYPPSSGEHAVYEKDDLIDIINYAVEKYYTVGTEAIGFYSDPTEQYVNISMKYLNFHNDTTQESIQNIDIMDKYFVAEKGYDNTTGKYNITEEFEYQNLSFPIKRIFTEKNKALCLSIACWVKFMDLDKTGQAIADLETLTTKVKCKSIELSLRDWELELRSEAVVVLAVLSLVLTICNIGFGVFLVWRTKQFMKKHYRRVFKQTDPSETDLPSEQYQMFIKWWDLTCLFSDVATLYGTIWIDIRENADIDVALLDSYTVWLGVGCLVAWFSLLRYFRFHRKFHLLFTTVYIALGDVFAYLICVGIMFIGFWACGYVVLGPYHVKFSTPTAATETLLAVINGDEIFTTIAILDKFSDTNIWLFARFYIWTYVTIFTIVVLNLLIAIVLNAYEVIKDNYEKRVEDRHLNTLELALKHLVEHVHDSSLRQPITDLMQRKANITQEESNLRAQLLKLFRIEDGELVTFVPRTLKAFMKAENVSQDRMVIEFKHFNPCTVIGDIIDRCIQFTSRSHVV